MNFFLSLPLSRYSGGGWEGAGKAQTSKSEGGSGKWKMVCGPEIGCHLLGGRIGVR